MTHYWKICYVELPKVATLLGKHSNWFCVRIPDPLVVGPNGFGPPVPPEPPEFEGTGLTTEDVRTLQTLAAIDRLAQALPATLSDGIQEAVEMQMKGVGERLNKGFELSRSEVAA